MIDINRQGATRIVFLVGKWVIKIPSIYSWKHFLIGLLANIQETEFSTLDWPELCPVVMSIPGGFMVLMPRASMMTREQFLEFDCQNFLSRADGKIPAEAKMNSFGYLDGRIIVVDYGGPYT